MILYFRERRLCMKKLFPIVLVFMLILSAAGVYAMDSEKLVGEVLYHQDFGDISDYSSGGIRLGTSSSENSLVRCEGDSLEVHTYDKGRVYVILPEAEKGDSDSYTIEFSFRFTDIHSENGFIAPILTCRGCEPANITSVTIRADGTVDEFSPLDDELKAAISSGRTIHVKIPVKGGMMYKILFTADGKEYTAERNNLISVSKGNIGFTVRNTNVEVDEVYLVNGTDYSAKSGYYADNSFARDDAPVAAANCQQSAEITAPPTGDNTMLIAVFAGAALIGIAALALMKKR